jgi:malonate decarboxylase alpha subunit
MRLSRYDPAKTRERQNIDGNDGHQSDLPTYEIRRLNYGIGYATAAIEVILPTFGAARGLKSIHFVLNAHPTLIPAIEAGFVGAAEAEASR